MSLQYFIFVFLFPYLIVFVTLTHNEYLSILLKLVTYHNLKQIYFCYSFIWHFNCI